MLAIKRDALRCPHCGERLSATSRFPLYAGIVGLLVLVFVAVVMFTTIHRSELNSDEPADTQTAQPVKPDRPPPFNK
jgi:hypothetical protein